MKEESREKLLDNFNELAKGFEKCKKLKGGAAECSESGYGLGIVGTDIIWYDEIMRARQVDPRCRVLLSQIIDNALEKSKDFAGRGMV